MKTASGNDALTYELDINEDMNADEIRIGASNIDDFVKGFAVACEDNDYKEEIAKIAKLTIKI